MTDTVETATADTDVPPRYLAGHLAPVPDETESFDLPVTGALPPELVGRYLRNGPNPLPGENPGHWFAGRGMVHGIRLTGRTRGVVPQPLGAHEPARRPRRDHP
jgi:carotenoid cleavage dioxygenase-like enzyme